MHGYRGALLASKILPAMTVPYEYRLLADTNYLMSSEHLFWSIACNAFYGIKRRCIILQANLLFLCNILRTLMFQMYAHPHEPSNFR